MDIAEKIRLLRMKKGLSQEELAEKVGVSRQSVSKWESNQAVPEINKLLKLSEIFGVTSDQLIDPKQGINDKEKTVHPEPQYTYRPNKNHLIKWYIHGRTVALIAGGFIVLGVLFGVITAFSLNEALTMTMPLFLLAVTNVAIPALIVGIVILAVNKSRLNSYFPDDQEFKDVRKNGKFAKIGKRIIGIGIVAIIVTLFAQLLIAPGGDEANDGMGNIELIDFSPTLVMNIVTVLVLISIGVVIVGAIVFIIGKIKIK